MDRVYVGKKLISGVGGRSSTDKNTFKDLLLLCAVAELTCSTFLTVKIKAKPCFISDPLFKNYFCVCVNMNMCACVSVCKNLYKTVFTCVEPRGEPWLLFFINNLSIGF